MTRTIVAVWGIFLMLLLESGSINAQISQGGNPIEIVFQKKSRSVQTVYKTPVSAVVVSPKNITTDQDTGIDHKPLKCAHPFSVSLLPSNSGEWNFQDNYKIWRLSIESEGALYVGLVFGKFRLPPGARLFVFSEDKTDIIGAFTESNNKKSGKFSTMPVKGDKICIQYEELIDSEFEGELEISRISHVYLDIKSLDPRRPIQLSGDCNYNVNCGLAEDYSDVKNSVCRIYIFKSTDDEVCSGVLINNTSNNGTPYVLTAAHSYDNDQQAQESLFLFNYESPYCGSIDGDNSHSISGATVKAKYDSLDFLIMELSVEPPNYFRPYYAGWDRSATVTGKTATIHHPWADIKKIAIDNDSPSTGTYSSDYVKYAFWKIAEWDYGVTEPGSSGCPLFDSNSRIIGVLTGGAARCLRPVYDYFAKIKMAWDYKSEQNKQLKYWLDPTNTNETKIDGYNPYSGEQKCSVLTNLSVSDTTQLKRISDNTLSSGYLSGTNSAGYTEFAEKFSGLNSCVLSGVSLGVARSYVANDDYDIVVKVYKGDDLPTTLLYTENFSMNELVPEAMNYLAFNQAVSTTGNFFISYSVSLLNQADTFAVYQAKRETIENSFYLKTNDGWIDYKTLSGSLTGSALLMELVACAVDDGNYPVFLKNVSIDELKIFPNPLTRGGKLTIQHQCKIENSQSIKIYNLMGQEIPFLIVSEDVKSIQLQLLETRAGIYILNLEMDGEKYSEKISLVP